jgi:polysaccharide biosynthesis transport protein
MLENPPDTTEAAKPRRRDHPPAADAAHSSTLPVTPGIVLGILRRRLGRLLASIVIIPLAAALSLHATTPRYTATGALLYDPPAFRLAELQSILRADPINDEVMASQAEVMHGLKIVARVATQLNLFDNPEFNHTLNPPSLPARALRRLMGWLAPAPRPAGAPRAQPEGPRIDDARNSVLLAAQQALVVTTTHGSHVITVTFTSRDRVLAAAAVNMVMDVYIKEQLGAKYRAVRKANEWLDARVAELRAQVRGDEDHIAAYRASHDMIQGMHAGLDAEQISHLTEGLVGARAALAAADSRVDAARGKTGATALAAIAPSVVQLRAQADALRSQLQGLNIRLGPNHPDVVNLRQQLQETERQVASETARVVAATEAEARAASQRVTAMEADLQQSRQAVDRNAQAQIPLDGMQREADAGRSLLQAVLGSIQQTAQQAAVEAPDAHEISLALPPESPSSPRVVPIMAGTSALGVLFGLLLVYITEITDSSLRSGIEVRTSLGLPCFALIPEVPKRRLGRMPIVAYGAMKPMSQFAEQLRALRAGLWMGTARPRIVAITAACPAEGKTSVALALGRAAALGGERVCLLLADSELGLTDLLAGHATDEQVLRQDQMSGMHYIAAGSQEANAFSLFMSEAMARLLQRLREKFDLVLLDAPPAQAMTDTRVIAGIADATLLCLRWRSTPLGVAELALAMLSEAGANVVGVALTRVDARVHLHSGSADAEVYHPRYGGYFRG